ncbi:hypothetical protein D6C93_10074 [Aureobasidium pullulans]|nr:hypothetical protein D6C93_10074 [Aureobasidium pullulans]
MPWGTFSRPRVQHDLGDSGEPSEDDQSLGQRRGNIEVRCDFRAKHFKWAADDKITKTLAFLYFEFEILQRNVSFELATVEIDIGIPCDKINSSITLKDCAPKNGVTAFARETHVEKKNQLDPDGNAEFLGGGLGLRLGSREKATSTTENRRCIFKAGTPSSEQNIPRIAEFRWEPNGDRDGASRTYAGALTLKCTASAPSQTSHGSGESPRPDPLVSGHLQRSSPSVSYDPPSPETPVLQEPPRSNPALEKNLKLKVSVTVHPRRWWQQLGHSGPKSKESNRIPLLETRRTTPEDFEAQEEELQNMIELRNDELAIAHIAATRAVGNPMPHRNRDVAETQAS